MCADKRLESVQHIFYALQLRLHVVMHLFHHHNLRIEIVFVNIYHTLLRICRQSVQVVQYVVIISHKLFISRCDK